jgi:uncharacterized protein/heat shock protein HslJ
MRKNPRIKFLVRLVLVLLEVAAAAVAANTPQQSGPTFDCAKASGEVEKLICSDRNLSAMDRKMAEVYAAAMKIWPADIATKERAIQRGWIKGRNDCWKAGDKRACVEENYRTRIVELQIRSGQLMVPNPVDYKCSGGEDKPFTVTFYEKTEPPSAVITYGDDQVIAFLVHSGSGKKYVANNMEFWEHHGETSVDWYGTRITCRVLSVESSPSAQTERMPLVGTTWELVQFQSMDDTTLKPGVGTPYTLSFDRDGRLRVQANCNRGQGTWRSPDNVSLELGQLAMTRAACPSKMYDRFVRDLQDVRSYIFKNGHLYLNLKVDAGTYEFRPLN